MPGALVEGFALVGVTGLGLGFFLLPGILFGEGGRKGSKQGVKQEETMQAHAGNTNTDGGVYQVICAEVSCPGGPRWAPAAKEGESSAGRRSGWLPRSW